MVEPLVKKDSANITKTGKKEYEWLAATTNPQKVKCMICNSTLKIGYMGVVAIQQHKTSDVHRSNCNASALNSLSDKFFIKTYTTEDNVIASEVT